MRKLGYREDTPLIVQQARLFKAMAKCEKKYGAIQRLPVLARRLEKKFTSLTNKARRVTEAMNPLAYA